MLVALFPIMLGAIGTVSRGEHLGFVALLRHGELFLVSTAVIGAGLAELFSTHDQQLKTTRLWVGCSAGVVLLSAATWFADVAAGIRDGSRLDYHTIAVGSVVVFVLALLTSVGCVLVAERAETLP
ncbi:MAG TPA: hypothetical protein VGY13_06875 [Solirubrobacteraceae bacterium]|nr:hypothetical protein [Solirubrobacteraceae bacterium]